MFRKDGGLVQQDSNSPVGVVRGRVNVHFNKSRNKYRLRFNSVHPDQLEMILLALEIARERANTQYDVVALEAMALEFLATYPSPKKPKAASVNLCAKCQAPVNAGLAPESPVNSCANSGAPVDTESALNMCAQPEKPTKTVSASKLREKRVAKPRVSKKRRSVMSSEMKELLKPLKSEEQWQEERRKLGYEKINGKIRRFR